MAALRTITPSITMPALARRLMPLATPDLFEVEDCDDSGAREHYVEPNDDDADCTLAVVG